MEETFSFLNLLIASASTLSCFLLGFAAGHYREASRREHERLRDRLQRNRVRHLLLALRDHLRNYQQNPEYSLNLQAYVEGLQSLLEEKPHGKEDLS